MATIHLVYPHGPRISAPDAIGRNLALRLRQRYDDVVLHNWGDTTIIRPVDGDVLVGHPHPFPNTCFRRSLRLPGWRRVLALGPYNHGDGVQMAFYESFLARCDLYLAITGNYWFDTIGRSLFAHWQPKMRHLDMAVDRADFPALKTAFNPPGERRFVYIGHSGWTKNPGFLEQIARRMPDVQFAWIGGGRRPIAGFEPLGYQDFTTVAARERLRTFDFMITASKSDANPTTILEAMAWGLIPVCTPQSGYAGHPGIPNIPLDIDRAVTALRQLHKMPGAALEAMQAGNWRALDDHFHWDRFAQQVIDAIESDDSPALLPCPWSRRVKIALLAATSPYFALHPRTIVAQVARLTRPWRQRLKVALSNHPGEGMN